MIPSPSRLRRAAFVVLIGCAAGALAIGTPTSAGTLGAALVDPKDAPAAVTACAIQQDSSGVFTPAITVTDRKPPAITEADVEIGFYDAANRSLGAVVVSPPYGPEGLPFGSVDHITCKVRAARFLDGSTYEARSARGGSAALPVAGVLLGAGAAALIIGSGHSSSQNGGSLHASPTPVTTASASTSATPAPVGTIIQLARPKPTPKPH